MGRERLGQGEESFEEVDVVGLVMIWRKTDGQRSLYVQHSRSVLKENEPPGMLRG